MKEVEVVSDKLQFVVCTQTNPIDPQRDSEEARTSGADLLRHDKLKFIGQMQLHTNQVPELLR